jgi:hypothetical protein
MLTVPFALVLLAGPAPGEPAPSEPEREAAPSEPAEPETSDPSEEPALLEAEQAETRAELEALERQNDELREEMEKDRAERAKQDAELRRELEELRSAQEHTDRRVGKMLRARLGGYVDVGFFWVDGDGSGVRPDIGRRFPEYDGIVSSEWVFMGDPLSVAVNSRGEPADTGPSRGVTFDPIDARSNPSLIVNALNLNPSVSLGQQFEVDALIDFLPRTRDVSRDDTPFLGDYVDIKRAQIRWIPPAKRFDLDVFAGKIDSVFGREYRYQEAPLRTTVTPSLICRYTCGRPVGLSTRWKFLPSRALYFAASLTNGSTVQEIFGFANEIDSNAFKTITSRVAYRFPVGAGLEIGASGEVGAQDLQPRDDRLHWQWGADLHLDVRGFELTGEFVQVRMQGRAGPTGRRCDAAACLRALGAYGLAGYHITNWVMPYFRTDWRSALHDGGTAFVYVAEIVRYTPGVRFDVGEHVALKAEYTFNRELERLLEFRNDVFTSSLVARF